MRAFQPHKNHQRAQKIPYAQSASINARGRKKSSFCGSDEQHSIIYGWRTDLLPNEVRIHIASSDHVVDALPDEIRIIPYLSLTKRLVLVDLCI